MGDTTCGFGQYGGIHTCVYTILEKAESRTERDIIKSIIKSTETIIFESSVLFCFLYVILKAEIIFAEVQYVKT